MDLLAHAGHRLTVIPDAEGAEGLMCESCGEYVFELADVEIVDLLAPATNRGAVSADEKLRRLEWLLSSPGDMTHSEVATEGLRIIRGALDEEDAR